MSIIKNYQDGKTELNKLKFKGNMGSGHPGSPPLIQKRIPTENKEASTFAGTGISKRADDVGRIGQLFARREGLQFLSNNTTLNLTPTFASSQQPKEGTTAFSQLKSNFATSALALPNAIKDTTLTLASTLASIPVAGTGTHFVKGALTQQAYLQRDYAISNVGETKSPLQKAATNLPDENIKSYFYNSARQTNVSNGLTGNDYIANPKDWQEKKTPKKTVVSIQLGDPATSKRRYDKDGAFYTQESQKSARDQVNTKDVFLSEDEIAQDYVKFLFEVLPIDKGSSSLFLQFRAFIGSFDDSFAGNWNSFNYVGRGEQFHTYQGFSRSVNVSFKSAVMTREELDPVYRKLNYLASTTAPSYSGQGIMRGTVVRMTIGNYIYDTPGFLSSVNFSWNTSYPWEIGMEREDDPKYKQLPHVLDCSLSFTPIHTFVPQTLIEKYIATDETL